MTWDPSPRLPIHALRDWAEQRGIWISLIGPGARLAGKPHRIGRAKGGFAAIRR